MRELHEELALFQLRSIALFAGCSDEQLRMVAAASAERRHAVGDTVSTAGARVRDVPIVLDGYAGAELGGRPLVVLGPGSVIGAAEALDGGLHSLTVVAQTPLVTRVVPASEFFDLIGGVPPLAIALIRQLGGRTRTVLDELGCARQGSVTSGTGSGSGARGPRSSDADRTPRPGRGPAPT
jgi:CRP-like cAMP-binding protein